MTDYVQYFTRSLTEARTNDDLSGEHLGAVCVTTISDISNIYTEVYIY